MTSAPATAELLRDLSSLVRHRVRPGRADAGWWKTDFGGVVRGTPGAVVRTSSEEELRAVLAYSRQRGVPLTLRGAGHTCNGQVVTDGGILLAHMSRRQAPPEPLDGNRFLVSGRSRWLEVEKALNRRGRAVPVLPDYLPMSVGGTLTVGGYGADSVVHGSVAEQVTRLRLIQPDGEAVWCSPDENPDLYDYSLAGLGQLGVIDQVVLRTTPFRRYTTLFSYSYPDFPSLIEACAWIADGGWRELELFKAHFARNRAIATYGVTSGSYFEARAQAPPEGLTDHPLIRRFVCPSYRLWRSRTVLAWVLRFGKCHRIWSDFFFDYSGLRKFSQTVDELLQADAFAGRMKSAYLVAVRNPPEGPRLPLEGTGLIESPVKWGIGLYSMVPKSDPGSLTRVRAAAAACLDRCAELGGLPYLYGWQELSDELIGGFYGERYSRLRQLRQELDPDGLFQPDKLLLRSR